jgi:hypothetical protein
MAGNRADSTTDPAWLHLRIPTAGYMLPLEDEIMPIGWRSDDQISLYLA